MSLARLPLVLDALAIADRAVHVDDVVAVFARSYGPTASRQLLIDLYLARIIDVGAGDLVRMTDLGRRLHRDIERIMGELINLDEVTAVREGQS